MDKHKMKKYPLMKISRLGLVLSILLLILLVAVSCSKENDDNATVASELSDEEESTLDEPTMAESTEAVSAAEVNTIDAEKAIEMMDSGDPYVLVDVRTKEEYDEGHIEGALLLPLDQLEGLAKEQLPDKDATILVYCRSGNRSAQASGLLLELGYTQIYDFGGIMDWPGEIVK